MLLGLCDVRASRALSVLMLCSMICSDCVIEIGVLGCTVLQLDIINRQQPSSTQSTVRVINCPRLFMSSSFISYLAIFTIGKIGKTSEVSCDPVNSTVSC